MDPTPAQLRERLDLVSCRAARSISRRLRRLEKEGRRRSPPGELAQIERTIAKAERALRARRESVPTPNLDETLPIFEKASEIERAIRDHQVVVICGETGSGKSTQLPLLCLKAGRGVRGLIGHTQPRRIAARTIASRLADELDVSLGREVGFKVRFDDSTDPSTFVKVMTDGVLLAELQSDRDLVRYDTIIIDEAHERSLNIDFLLGCLKRILAARPELRVVITSATIDPDRFAEHFGGSPVIEVSGRTYPVEVLYRDPVEDGAEEGVDADANQPIVDAVAELASHGPGDILVFLPGEREIREATEALEASPDRQTQKSEVLPLYARLAAKDQLRAFTPHERRRVILATNIAETSVTVPGVHYVVDTGLARINRYHARSRVQGLDVEPVSQASANQRAGRCGRVADGVCIRLYAKQDFADRAEYTDPEILRSNLAGVVLRMKALKLGDPRGFPFLDTPSPRRVRDAYETLHELGALDETGELTPIGRELAAIPIDPRLGRMLLAATEEGALREVTVIVAALATRDPRERPLDARDEADAAHAPLLDESSDFLTLLSIWRAAREQQKALSVRQFRKWCSKSFLSWRGLREWDDLRRQLRRLIRDRGLVRNTVPATPDAIHRAVLSGLLSNIGTRGDRHEYQGTLGTEFFVHPGSVCFERKPRWIVAAEIAKTARVYARMVAPIRPEWIESLGQHLLERSHSQPTWDRRADAPTVVERVSLLGVQLPSKKRVAYGHVNPIHARELFIRQGLVDGAFRPKAEFVDHNDQVIGDVRRLEAKARRTDHESEAGARFDFYDKQIPAHVWTGKRFDRWRHKAEARDPDVLCMSLEDLIVWAEEAPAPAAYPDSVEIAGREREIEYHHDPGAEDDGVAIVLPLAAFHGLTEAAHDWLVPGLVAERAQAMIRALPKPIRRGIGPGPQAVEEFLAAEPDRGIPLADSLADWVQRTRGVGLSATDLRLASVSTHLVARIVVQDESGEVITEGRDLALLRRAVSDRVDEVLHTGAASVEPRDGIREWDASVGELPESVPVATGGGEVDAFPALLDRDTSVALRLLPDLDAAKDEHVRGVRRLLAMRHRRILRRTLRDYPGVDALRLAHAALGLESVLDDQIGLLALNRVVAARPLFAVRSPEAFEMLADHVESRLDAALLGALDTARSVYSPAKDLLTLLDRRSPPAWRDAVEETREHARLLLTDDFLSETPDDRLAHLPRYLKASKARLDKLGSGGLDRDGQRVRELSPRWSRWVELDRLLDELPEGTELGRALAAYRWMLEEFRVSLFAQELGTRTKVSAKRIDAQWQEVRKALHDDARAASLYASHASV